MSLEENFDRRAQFIALVHELVTHAEACWDQEPKHLDCCDDLVDRLHTEIGVFRLSQRAPR